MRWNEYLAKTLSHRTRLWLYATGLTDKSLCLKLEMSTDTKHADKLRELCGALQQDTAYISGCAVDITERQRFHRQPTITLRIYADSYARLSYFLSTHEYTDFRVMARRMCLVGGVYALCLISLNLL